MNPDKNIESIVRAIVVKNDKILLCNNLKHNFYFLPGGHIEEGEPPEGALKRETLEELNKILQKTKYITKISNSFVQEGEQHDEVFLIYLVALEDYENIESKEDHIRFEWVPINNLPLVDLQPRKAISDILKSIKENKNFWIK